eukprot:scaffold138141_cov18-Tisochrysis_lutea.AAC.1
MHTHTQKCTNAYTCAHSHTHSHTFTGTHTRTHTHTHARTHVWHSRWSICRSAKREVDILERQLSKLKHGSGTSLNGSPQQQLGRAGVVAEGGELDMGLASSRCGVVLGCACDSSPVGATVAPVVWLYFCGRGEREGELDMGLVSSSCEVVLASVWL